MLCSYCGRWNTGHETLVTNHKTCSRPDIARLVTCMNTQRVSVIGEFQVVMIVFISSHRRQQRARPTAQPGRRRSQHQKSLQKERRAPLAQPSLVNDKLHRTKLGILRDLARCSSLSAVCSKLRPWRSWSNMTPKPKATSTSELEHRAQR